MERNGDRKGERERESLRVGHRTSIELELR